MTDTNIKVLIAEDEIASRRMLEKRLSSWGYQVIPCSDGKKAWEVLQNDNSPMILVLDWLMPGYSGVELCKMLEAKGDTDSYRILVTAKNETEDIVAALEAGAHDFISKPFDTAILKSRLGVGSRLVSNRIALQEMQLRLAEHAVNMESLANERAKQLVMADRMATLGIMTAGIAHEVNNPTTFISGNLQNVETFWNEIRPALEEHLKQTNAPKLKFVLEEMPAVISGIRSGVERIRKIVDGLRVYSRTERNGKEPCSLNDSVEQALLFTNSSLKGKVTVIKELDLNLPKVNADPHRIEQVLVNLIVNAAQAMEKVQDPKLRISSHKGNGTVVIEIEDSGPGLPLNNMDKIWTPFFTTKDPGKGTGLGLHVCQTIINENGGQLYASNGHEGGAKFVISLPAVK